MSFEDRVSRLARQAGLKIAESSHRHAKLLFTINGHVQPVFVIAAGDVWEFSCPMIGAFDRLGDIPHILMAIVLEQNVKLKRGFWGVETVGGKKRLECMHNVDDSLITPHEFTAICQALISEVETVETALRELANELS